MKKITLGGVQSAPSTARAKHPTVNVTDAEMQVLLNQFALINPQYKTLEAQTTTLKGQLSGKIKALYFDTYCGREPETSTILVTAGGRTIKLIVKNLYSKSLTDDADLLALLGEEIVSQHFRQSTLLSLDLDKAPEDKQEAFANAVLELANKMGVMDAVSAKQCIQPKAGFHEARTRMLTKEQNVALDALLPVTAYPQL